MRPREHAFIAAALVNACGGVEATLGRLQATPYTMGQSTLYDCLDPSKPRTMPIGAVGELEAQLNWRYYSLRLFRQLDTGPDPATDPMTEACNAFESMAAVQALTRKADLQGYTENRCREIEQALIMVESSFARLRASMDVQLGQAVRQ